jgi:hypothetical protein
VSSVFGKDHKTFGKKHLFDGREDTCWNSDQGLPQHVTVKFEQPQRIRAVRYVSQGGFCPRELVIHIDGVERARAEMLDSNKEEVVEVEGEGEVVKVEFVKSSDLFGRIVMYKFEVLK